MIVRPTLLCRHRRVKPPILVRICRPASGYRTDVATGYFADAVIVGVRDVQIVRRIQGQTSRDCTAAASGRGLPIATKPRRCHSLFTTVLMFPLVVDHAHLIYGRYVHVTRGIHCQGSRLLTPAEIASPPSPEATNDPVPAIVLMVPSGVTLRILLFSISAIYILPLVSHAMPSGK